MKKLLVLATALLVLAGCAPKQETDPDIAAARALAGRILGKSAKQIEFCLIPAANGNAASESGSAAAAATPGDGEKDVFRIESSGRKIRISGNNANSMAVGLNHYLKYFCNVNVGWFVWDEVVLPEKFPVVAEPIEIKARVEERFFLNYCTFGYTMHGGTGTSGSISSTGWPSTG